MAKRQTRTAHDTGTRKRAAGKKGSVLAGLPEGFTPAQYEFAITYLANGFNASGAAQRAYPNQTKGAALQQGHENLRKPHIKAFILSQLDDRWKSLHMSGDEALARVAGDARADLRMLFGTDGKLLKPHEWPDEIADSVEGVDVEKGRVKLASKGNARRTILEVTGKVKGESTVDQLVEAMKATIEKNAEKAKAKKG